MLPLVNKWRRNTAIRYTVRIHHVEGHLHSLHSSSVMTSTAFLRRLVGCEHIRSLLMRCCGAHALNSLLHWPMFHSYSHRQYAQKTVNRLSSCTANWPGLQNRQVNKFMSPVSRIISILLISQIGPRKDRYRKKRMKIRHWDSHDDVCVIHLLKKWEENLSLFRLHQCWHL